MKTAAESQAILGARSSRLPDLPKQIRIVANALHVGVSHCLRRHKNCDFSIGPHPAVALQRQ